MMKAIRNRWMSLVLALLMLFTLAACGPAPGGESTPPADSSGPEQSSGVTDGRTEPLVLRVGWPTTGQEGDVVLPGIDAVCSYVTEQSGGMITFEYFPNQLLGTETDMTDQLITGDLDIAVISNNVAATYWPEFYIYGLPFAFDSFEKFWDLCGIEGWNDGAFTKAIREAVESTGQVHFLDVVCNTYRGMQSNGRPVTSLEDFEGLTLRVQAGEMYADIYYALGASTSSIPFGELYTSMQSGVVDAEDVGIATCVTNRYYEVEEYAVELNHCMTANLMLMSNACFDQLTEQEQQWFMEGCILAEQAAYEAVSTGDEAAYQTYADNGVTVIRQEELDPADLQEMRDATASVWDKYQGMIDENVFTLFETGLAELNAGA